MGIKSRGRERFFRTERPFRRDKPRKVWRNNFCAFGKSVRGGKNMRRRCTVGISAASVLHPSRVRAPKVCAGAGKGIRIRKRENNAAHALRGQCEDARPRHAAKERVHGRTVRPIVAAKKSPPSREGGAEMRRGKARGRAADGATGARVKCKTGFDADKFLTPINCGACRSRT